MSCKQVERATFVHRLIAENGHITIIGNGQEAPLRETLTLICIANYRSVEMP
jgi:hypothetical protein